MLALLLFTIQCVVLVAQDSCAYVLAFYNVENLFNPADDSLKNDDSFTPEGFNHWTYRKYVRKINNIAKVFFAMGDWQPPDIIGMAEIEEAAVLRKLCYDSPLQKFKYGFAHYDSPDARGIDVAMLYRKQRVTLSRSVPVGIRFPFDTAARNRDVLYAVLNFPNGDSLHLFVNHWTSRYGGYAPTIAKRNYYAAVVRHLCDSILATAPAANIVLVGDFNDYPTDESMTSVLRAGDFLNQKHVDYKLFNLMSAFVKMNNVGTHKHEDFWGCLDQIIVSSSLLDTTSTLYVAGQQAHIFKSDFLLEQDEKYGGYKNYRTFLGPRYIGGFSDHLPIYIRLRTRSKKSDTS